MPKIFVNFVSISNLSEKNGISTFINGFFKLNSLFILNDIVINKTFVAGEVNLKKVTNSESNSSLGSFKTRFLKNYRMYKFLQFLYFYLLRPIFISIRLFHYYNLKKSHKNHIYFLNDFFVGFFVLKLLPTNAKTVIIFHSSDDPLRHFFLIFPFLKDTIVETFLRRMLNYVVTHSQSIVTLSQNYSNKLQIQFPNKIIRCIYNTSFISNVKSDLVNSDFKFSKKVNILSIGSLQYVKGFDILISAIGQLPIIYRNKIMLRIAGEGDERSLLENLIFKYDLKDNVLLLGNIDNVPKLLEECDVFCLPSREEGLPISIIEALSFHKPIICTRVGSLPEIFTESDCVFIDHDIDNLQNILMQIISDGNICKDLSLKSKKIYYNLFSNRTFSYKYSLLFNDVYNNLL